MADKQGRKWQLTINNPQDKGLDHDAIKLALDDLRSLDYYCMADEIGLETHTPHTHLFNQTVINTTGEPVTEQAPAVDTTSTSDNTPVYLPAGYLSEGYYATTDSGAKYLRPEFVGKYAEIMASLLADMKPADFNGLLREMKRSKKKTLPFEARLTAAAEMLPKALALVHRKKAPALLVTFIKDNLDHIHNDDDWFAYHRHLEAIGGYLSMPAIIKE